LSSKGCITLNRPYQSHDEPPLLLHHPWTVPWIVVLGQSTSMFRLLKSRAVIVTGDRMVDRGHSEESEDPISISEWSAWDWMKRLAAIAIILHEVPARTCPRVARAIVTCCFLAEFNRLTIDYPS